MAGLNERMLDTGYQDRRSVDFETEDHIGAFILQRSVRDDSITKPVTWNANVRRKVAS